MSAKEEFTMQTQTQQTRSARRPQKKVRANGPAAVDREVLPKVSKNLEHLLRWYEHPSSRSLKNLRDHYSKDVFFKDPLVELYTTEELEKYYSRMFEKFSDLRFTMENKFEEAHQAFVTWTMSAVIMGRGVNVRGASHFKFDPSSGLCDYHRAYFDLAEEVYEQIPLLGYVFKGLKRVLN
jgi:hypothetical protein